MNCKKRATAPKNPSNTARKYAWAIEKAYNAYPNEEWINPIKWAWKQQDIRRDYEGELQELMLSAKLDEEPDWYWVLDIAGFVGEQITNLNNMVSGSFVDQTKFGGGYTNEYDSIESAVFDYDKLVDAGINYMVLTKIEKYDQAIIRIWDNTASPINGYRWD